MLNPKEYGLMPKWIVETYAVLFLLASVFGFAGFLMKDFSMLAFAALLSVIGCIIRLLGVEGKW